MTMTGAINHYPLQMTARGVWLALGLLTGLLRPVCASSGGEYLLDISVVDGGGGGLSQGGEYSARGGGGAVLPGEGPGSCSQGEYVNRSGFYNPPHFTYQKGQALVASFKAGAVAISLPAGAVDKDVFDVAIGDESGVAPSVLNSANSKIELQKGAQARPLTGTLTKISFFDEQSALNGPVSGSGVVTLRYCDADNDGILDGSSPPVRVSTIRPWLLDESLEVWAKPPGASMDTFSKVVSMPLSSPGVFALLGAPDETVSDSYAFPVPFRPYGPQSGTAAGGSGSEAEGITFMNVPQSGEIEIYTLDGRLARKISIPAGLIIPKVKWDVRTAGGERAASGVYVWRVVSGSNSKTGKLMVIW